MQIHCAYTDKLLKADGNNFASVTVVHTHPIFALPLKQLARMASLEHINKEEGKLLFLALCLQLPTIRIAGTVPLQSFADEIPQLCTSSLLDLVLPIRKASEQVRLPEFILTSESCNALPAYIAILQDFVEYGRHIPIKLAGDSLDDPIAMAERLAEAKAMAKASAQRKAQEKLTAVAVIQWAIKETNASELRAKLWKQVLTKQSLPIDLIQDLISDCLDNLPEYTELNNLRKSWLLDKLHCQLVEKLTIQSALGVDIQDSTDYLNAISTSYTTTSTDGKLHYNMGTSSGSALANLELVNAAHTRPPARVSMLGLPRPIQANYPNALGYMAAMKRWQLDNPAS